MAFLSTNHINCNLKDKIQYDTFWHFALFKWVLCCLQIILSIYSNLHASPLLSYHIHLANRNESIWQSWPVQTAIKDSFVWVMGPQRFVMRTPCKLALYSYLLTYLLIYWHENINTEQKHTSFSANSAMLKLPKPVDNACAFCLPRFAMDAQHWASRAASRGCLTINKQTATKHWHSLACPQ